jgi:glycosyltransferase involved in cell wall biosynthesis
MADDKRDDGRIRVLFVIPDLSGGGAERAVSTYLRHLDRSRFEPGLCVFRNTFVYDVPDNIPVWVMDKTRPWHVFRTIRRMKQLLRVWQPDLIHSHLAYANVLSALAIKMTGNRPFWIPHVHNNPLTGYKWLPNWIWTRMKKKIHRVAVVSKGIGESLHKNFGVDQRSITTLYNPIDFEQIEFSIKNICLKPDDSPTIVTMGRLVSAKDHGTLIRAVALVKNTHKVRLFIMGEGPLRKKLESLVVDLALNKIVEMKGFFEDPFPHVAMADIFVLSSKWEGFGNVLVEAMSCNTAVISTDCPHGPREIIENGKTGILVPIENPKALAKAIICLLDNEDKRNKMSTEGKKRANTLFNALDRTRELERFFLSALMANN